MTASRSNKHYHNVNQKAQNASRYKRIMKLYSQRVLATRTRHTNY
jgi:hypothetical protein